MNEVPLASLPSRTPLHPLRTSERIDPYWSSLWRGGSTGDWFSASDNRRLSDSGLASAPTWLRMDAEEALARIVHRRSREKSLRVLAALDQWRTMSVQQVEALTDVSGIAAGNTSLVSALWNAGLVDICMLGSALAPGSNSRAGMLLRPARTSDATRAFEEHLTYPEWVSVTSGLGLDANRQFTRHNVLATELGLRLSEYGRCAMVLGEKLSGMQMLAYSGSGLPVPRNVSNGSDLTVVRADGLRVAVEVTASRGRHFDLKVQKLVEILSRRPLAESALCVLFVTAPHQDATQAEANELLRGVKRAIQKAVRAFPGTATDPTSMRVGVVSWSDLFPSAHTGAADFGKLPAERPTGGGFIGDPTDERVWERGLFLDPVSTPLHAADPEALSAVLSNASGLRGVPHVLRRADRPLLSELSLRDMEFDEVPQAEGTMSVAVARGASGSRQLPERLRF